MLIPTHIIKESKNFRPEGVGVSPPLGVRAHICATVIFDGGETHNLSVSVDVARV